MKNHLFTTCFVAAGLVSLLTGCAQAPLALQEMGSFHIGGREVSISGKPVSEIVFTAGGVPAKVDPNGIHQVEQMYVQYFVPARRRGRLPLLMWHGGGLTGVTYETTPDGREGWLNYFIRQGWTVYNSDAVERGRSGWAMYPDIFAGAPVFLTKPGPFERFRIGAGAGSYDEDAGKMRLLPGNQFPVAAYDNFIKQNVPRWTSTDDAILRAYAQLVDKLCPCIVLAHSQGGPFAVKAAQAQPEKIKALVLIEPAGGGTMADAAKLRDTAILTLYGDYIGQDARWPKIRANGIGFLDQVRAAGGKPEVIDLPDIGIKGNSHMMMMDKNNLQVADVIQQWLANQGFYH
ncbi:esterase [Verminephrobacter eiseniae]|uniref:esterase n=1 Tax=Verminephrobacter eiseniae TaxID=364317 RepID=UPI00223826C2|nr:esterase [Verminephrobacter eiseniae]MCW5262113.1 esterase [Verminephrobacter eiseniae]